MRAHPEVCFEVESVVSPARWQSVMAHGEFQELMEPAARDAALAVLGAQGENVFPPSIAPYQDGIERLVIYRIRVTEVTGRFERDEVFQPCR
jgi:nitroimidazol reductase NimA-like FMN-containing flavoprotein (pyridoxamine 5'-phosphate oxidase superfamily)